MSRPYAYAHTVYHSALRPALRVLGTSGQQRALFLLYQRRFLRLTRPRTFSDLVMRRILQDRSEHLVWACDKLAQKDRVEERARTARPIPTIWSGPDARGLLDVDLPERWVLKRNDSSGWVYFGTGQVTPSQVDEIARGARANTTPYERNGEWAYSQVEPLLFVEPHVGEPGADLIDYKFFVFSGKAVVVQVHTDRSHHQRMSYFDRRWRPLDVTTRKPRCDDTPPPAHLTEMLEDAESIAQGFDFLRVDFYEVDGTVYFGETTVYPSGGLRRFRPRSFDEWLGREWMKGAHYRPDLRPVGQRV